jgi:hypothetical protein
MGLFSKDITNMEDLFVHTLRDIYYAEKQIEKALPDMIEKSSEPQLKQGFQTHLQETKNHVKRLQQVFKLAGKEPSGVDCPAIDGIARLWPVPVQCQKSASSMMMGIGTPKSQSRMPLPMIFLLMWFGA